MTVTAESKIMTWDSVALKALEDMEAGKSVFLTGRAGTGKSTLLKHFRDTTSKNIAVVAPTGVAAVNIQGQTIHSFFRFSIGVTLDSIKKKSAGARKIFENLDTLVVDEISMVRADLFDCMDRFLRLNGPNPDMPFGGIQLVLVGDMCQLPPVVPPEEREIFEDFYEGPYFFNAMCFRESSLQKIELRTVHRQTDPAFIGLLDAVRDGEVSERQLAAINERVNGYPLDDLPEFCVLLTTRNDMAHRYNDEKILRIEGKAKIFVGEVEGEFPESAFPTTKEITLKVGAQVMLLNNDPVKRWINGDIGRIVGFGEDEENDAIQIQLASGKDVKVGRVTWNKHRYAFNRGLRRIETEVVGSYTQIPLRLSWAVTIHKAQGKTFDQVAIDFGNGTFTSGQAYVALSRCRSLGGISLRRPLQQHHLMLDPRLTEFLGRVK